jgi:hypothetical protein
MNIRVKRAAKTKNRGIRSHQAAANIFFFTDHKKNSEHIHRELFYFFDFSRQAQSILVKYHENKAAAASSETLFFTVISHHKKNYREFAISYFLLQNRRGKK